MILKWHLLVKIIIKICKKIFEFCGNPSKFLTRSYLFIFCAFGLTEEGLIHQLHLRKYAENKAFYCSSQKAKNEKKVQKYNSIFIIIISKNPERLSLIAA